MKDVIMMYGDKSDQYQPLHPRNPSLVFSVCPYFLLHTNFHQQQRRSRAYCAKTLADLEFRSPPL